MTQREVKRRSPYPTRRPQLWPRRRLTVAYNKAPNGGVSPAIRFSGTFLEHLGFVAGEQYELIINDDLSLTIRPVS